MPTREDRISTLETRVFQLETWSGPGQIEALMSGMRGIRGDIRGIRGDMTAMRRVQDRHSRQLAELQTDVAGLKIDVAEILRRLPEPPASG